MRFHLLNVVFGLVLINAGCGGPTGPVGAQSQVSGTVTNDGKPVTLNSQVVFYNKDKGLTLTGVLDSLGKYSLTAGDPKLGVPAGRYEVSVMPPVAAFVEISSSSDEYKQKMMAGMGKTAIERPAEANTAPDIPEKFRDPKTSGLVFEVKEGPNTYDFDLSKL